MVRLVRLGLGDLATWCLTCVLKFKNTPPSAWELYEQRKKKILHGHVRLSSCWLYAVTYKQTVFVRVCVCFQTQSTKITKSVRKTVRSQFHNKWIEQRTEKGRERRDGIPFSGRRQPKHTCRRAGFPKAPRRVQRSLYSRHAVAVLEKEFDPQFCPRVKGCGKVDSWFM